MSLEIYIRNLFQIIKERKKNETKYNANYGFYLGRIYGFIQTLFLFPSSNRSQYLLTLAHDVGGINDGIKLRSRNITLLKTGA